MWASCQIGIKVNAQNKAKQTVRIRCEGANISYTCTFIYTLRDIGQLLLCWTLILMVMLILYTLTRTQLNMNLLHVGCNSIHV